MIHVKQYAKKEMDDWNGVGLARWKGKTFNAANTNYYNLPWEKEALSSSRQICKHGME